MFVNVAGGMRIDEPGADLAVALAIASAARGVRRSRAPRSSARSGSRAVCDLRPRRSDGSTNARSSVSPRSSLQQGRLPETAPESWPPIRCEALSRSASGRLHRAPCGRCCSVKTLCENRYHEACGRQGTRCRHFFVMASNTEIGEAGLFDIGDKVVYPHHGAGTVVKREKREVLGETREYLTIQILHNDMTVNVPCDNAERVGLRQVIDQRTVTMVVRTLSGGSTEMPKNWNRRFKHNRDKMKTGNIFESPKSSATSPSGTTRKASPPARSGPSRRRRSSPRSHVREGHGRGGGGRVARRRAVARRPAEVEVQSEAQGGRRECIGRQAVPALPGPPGRCSWLQALASASA